MPIIGCIVPLLKASRNSVLLADQLNAIGVQLFGNGYEVKRAVPPDDHHSFAQHVAIVRAICERDLRMLL